MDSGRTKKARWPTHTNHTNRGKKDFNCLRALTEKKRTGARKRKRGGKRGRETSDAKFAMSPFTFFSLPSPSFSPHLLTFPPGPPPLISTPPSRFSPKSSPLDLSPSRKKIFFYLVSLSHHNPISPLFLEILPHCLTLKDCLSPRGGGWRMKSSFPTDALPSLNLSWFDEKLETHIFPMTIGSSPLRRRH